MTENKDQFFQLLFYAVSHLDGSVPRFASYKVSFIGWVLIPLAEVNLEIQGEVHWGSNSKMRRNYFPIPATGKVTMF